MASGKIVLITGGNTGIGLETCKALLRSDRLYHILLGGRDINKAQDAAKASTAEIESKSSVEAIQVDVEEDESITKAFELVSSKHSRLDCLINNAGMSHTPSVNPSVHSRSLQPVMTDRATLTSNQWQRQKLSEPLSPLHFLPSTSGVGIESCLIFSFD